MSYKGRGALSELFANGKKRAQVIFDARDDADGSVRGAGHRRTKLRIRSLGRGAFSDFFTLVLVRQSSSERVRGWIKLDEKGRGRLVPSGFGSKTGEETSPPLSELLEIGGSMQPGNEL